MKTLMKFFMFGDVSTSHVKQVDFMVHLMKYMCWWYAYIYSCPKNALIVGFSSRDLFFAATHT